MKKICAWLLVMTMMLSCMLPISAFAETKTDFEAFDLEIATQGMSPGKYRFVVAKGKIPFDVTEENMIGLKVEGKIIDGEGKDVPYSSAISAVEIRDTAVVLVVPEPSTAPVNLYRDSTDKYKHKFELKVYPEKGDVASSDGKAPAATEQKPATSEQKPVSTENTKTDFEAFKLVVSSQGMAGTDYRFVVSKTKIPFEVTEGNLVGLKIRGNIIDGDKNVDFSSAVSKVELRDTAVILVVPQPKTAPVSQYRDTTSGKYTHKFDLTVYPEVGSADSIDTTDLPKKDMKFSNDCVYYFLNYKNFADSMGGWTKEGSGIIPNMYGAGGDKTATTKLTVPYDETYYVWGRSKDFATDRPATRTADVSIDDTKFETLLGTHKMDDFQWQLLGSVKLKQGDHTISVHTTGNYARFDMLAVTDDENFEPVNAIGTLADIYNYNTYDASKIVPSVKPEKEIVIDPNRPATDVAVKLNDEWMTFDVDPVILNGRTLVPMRAIFEALGCTVTWYGEEQTAIGSRNGMSVMVTIGSNDAFIAGNSTTIDQPPVLMNGRTLVPLRFISEAFGCKVIWEQETKSVFIEAEDVPLIYYFDHGGFVDVGTWSNKGEYLQGISDSANENGDFDGKGAKPAKVIVNVAKAGTYKLWVRARDYATNQPGSRFFHAALDGKRSDEKLGDHGKEGFYWEEVGTYELAEGNHTIELHDTSGFFARCNGVILCSDPKLDIPNDQSELNKLAAPYNPMNEIPMPSYPAHSKENFAAVATDSIESATTKVVFYQGESSKGSVVQNEIYAKDKTTGEWVLVKRRTEDFGFLMMSADEANYTSGAAELSVVAPYVEVDGNLLASSTTNFYKFGLGTWLIPQSFEKVSDKEVKLNFGANDKVAFSATFKFDDLVDDVKVTINANVLKKGAYSFAMFTGDGVEKEEFETVTAPMLYVKHALPEGPTVLTEAFLFTPMNTFNYAANNNIKTPGRELTYGIAVDPTSISQHFAHPDTSEFGALFYTPGGKARPHIVAPMMGTESSKLDAGENYQFSYRIVNQFEGWYDTFKRVATKMLNNTDIRTNYYGSVNDCIYNVADLIMDDFYGGWDDDWKGYYNMEGSNLVSQSNAMSVLQRYLLSEDEAMLEERVIPTIAYVVSRGGAHYSPVLEREGSSGYTAPGSSLGGFAGLYNAAVWGGIYEASQGRMPWLLDHALNSANASSVTGASALYKYSGKDEKYRQNIIEIADKYLETYPDSEANRDVRLVNSFVYGDYTVMTATLVAAYELTGEQKYLDLAEKAGRLLMTATWTTGYEDDNATTPVHIDSDKIVERILNVDRANFNFFWHGEKKWRPGNEDGFDYSAKEMNEMGIGPKVPEEDIPGWLATRTGMGTEHASTPGHGNVITMNNWLGTMVRLSVYTGDEWFETQARNAIIGRYQNYPGYYIDRYVSSPMHKDYPYVGPDMTSLYWHHIPIFLSMVEDFLVNEAWAKSKQNIDFPYVYQGGYAYFNSYQYGQAAGKFSDEDDMWLWIEKGVVNPDNINIDYVAAKKDGVMGIGLMNEDNKELTTTVTLGEKVGTGITTTATLYDADGNKSTVEVVNNQFTVTIPSKGIMSVVIKDLANVKKPEYVKEYTYSNQVGQTASSHGNGMGYVIQLTDDEYWAYVYISNNIKTAKSATLTYTVNGETKKVTDDKACFEWLIKVDDPMAAFEYSIEVEDTNGNVANYGGGVLKTLQASPVEPKVTIGEKSAPSAKTIVIPPCANALKFDPFDVTVNAQGNDGSTKFRLVCSTKNFPFEATAENLVGLKLVGNVVDGDVSVPYEAFITGVEPRGADSVVLIAPQTPDVTVAKYLDQQAGRTHKFVLQMFPQ